MKLKRVQYFITGLFLLFVGSVQAQNVFQKTYGGTAADFGEGIKATSDLGFIVTGTTRSYGTLGGEARDFFTMKANLLGITTWTRELGITNNRQEGKIVKVTSDGGYIVGGRTYELADGNDSWLLKKYSAVGAPIYENVFGKNSGTAGGSFAWDDELYAIDETPAPYPADHVTMVGFTMDYRANDKKDMSFVIYNMAGAAISITRHIGTAAGGGGVETGRDFVYESGSAAYTLLGESNAMVAGNGADFLAVKLTGIYGLGTYKSFGGTGVEEARTILKTSDGGYFMMGWTNSPGVAGGNDLLCIKTDVNFNLTWAKAVGGTGDELGIQAKQTSDGGYIIIGQTTSFNTFSAGGTDMFVVKLTGAGALSWAKVYGGSGYDDGRNLDIRSDGGFFFSGSCSEPVSPVGNGQDIFVVAANSTGYSGGCNEASVTPTVNNIALTSATVGLSSTNTLIGMIAEPMTPTSTAPTLTCKCENYAPNKEIQGLTQVCHNTSHVYYINSIPGHTNYLWTLTGATFAVAPGATDTSVTLNFTNTNAQLIVATNDGNCSDFVIDTIDISIDNIATAITTPDSLLCVGDGTALTANTVNAQGGIAGWVWTPAGPNNAVNNVTPGITTLYSVTVTDGWGCTAGDQINVQVFNYPVVNIGPNDTVCNGGPVLLNATTAGATYLWNTAAVTPTINALTTGTYWVDVTTSIAGCTKRDSIILGISVGPTITITGDDSICVGQNTTLTANPSLGTAPYTYLWTGGLGIGNSITVSPILNTTYTVTVTEAFGCTNTATKLVNVFAYPVVNIGPNDTVCNGGPVLLNATTASASYVWNTAATSATINAPTSGTYWVDVNRFGCVTRDSIILGISTPPVINIVGDDSICIGQSTTLTANPSGGTGPYTYLWAGGLGSSNSITVSPILNTTYTVTVTESFGCTNTNTRLVNVFAYPAVNIGPDDTICTGGPVLLNATTAGGSYVWNTAAVTPTINALTTGIYWVDVNTNGCVKRDSINLHIGITPISSILGLDTICIGSTDTLVASAVGGTLPYTYTWAAGLGTNDSIVVSPGGNTSYFVNIQEVNGCSSTGSLLVHVLLYPIVNLGPDTGICNGAVPFVTLDAQNAGLSYTWSTSATTQTINVNTSGPVWVDVSNNGCSTRDSVVVNFSTTPTSGFTGITTICAGTSTMLYGNGSGGTSPYTYTWSVGPTLADSISLSPPLTANFNVITADVAGCSDTAFFTITVNQLPIVNLGADTTGCLNTPITLIAPVTLGTTLWSTGASTNSISVPAASTVWVDITENGCTTRDSIVVNYYPIPNVNLGPDTVICSIQSITLDATNIFSTYVWSNAATTPTIVAGQSNLYWVNVTSCGIVYSDSISVVMDTFSVHVVSMVPNDCGTNNGALTVGSNSIYPTTYLWTAGAGGTNPVLVNISNGNYTVDATDSVGCVATATIPVPCLTPTIIITQLVTPNGDGKNDTWIIQNINNFPKAKVEVFNRWGNLVYNSSPYANNWDGKSNSGMSLGNGYLPAGTYYYVVDVYGDGSDVKSGYLEFQP